MKGGGIVFHPTSKRRVPAVSGHRARPGAGQETTVHRSPADRQSGRTQCLSDVCGMNREELGRLPGGGDI